MALTPEKKVKNSVVKILKELDIYYFFPATYGYGRSGVPDIVCCAQGDFLGIECKAGANKVTTLQRKELDAIINAGGKTYVVNESNLDALKFILEEQYK
jgi:Holliday junction resolvase